MELDLTRLNSLLENNGSFPAGDMNAVGIQPAFGKLAQKIIDSIQSAKYGKAKGGPEYCKTKAAKTPAHSYHPTVAY